MLQGFLVAAVSALIYLESRIGGQHMLDRPIIIGPVVGLIMGDFQSGLFIGGQLELVWMGLVGIGTSTPPDVVVGSALATALAIKTGATYETTLALAIPIALLAQLVSIGVCILNTAFAHKADACAEKGDYRGVEVSNWLGTGLYFILSLNSQ
ncbi:MAG: PTS sugar transporter subunit IIC [Anaerorhabdus sp.]|uniref:PTS sugar transporter subunit IIC n=1 Tax=Anaerorhabdus sp. TaxID=1872524 RepID=UPI003A894E86